MKGLDGSPKMTKRNPMSYFTFSETSDSIAKKISNAFTGGKPTVAEQRKLGGVPEICPIFEMELYHFIEEEKIVVKNYNDCRTGKLLCGEHKAQTIRRILKVVENHRRRKQKFVDKAIAILDDNYSSEKKYNL